MVSRQALYLKPKTPKTEDGKVVALHLVAPPLPENGLDRELGPGLVELEVAIHVMARRHPAAGYGKVTARLRRTGYVVNKKKVARLLRVWGLLRARPKSHPKAQGRPLPHHRLQRAVADRRDEYLVR